MSEMWINMGPQHPMTHGLWNLRVKIDGELVLDVDPEMGYLHRGIEKISEDRHYNEIITLMDRTCYVAGMAWEHLFIQAAEHALHIQVPERAQWIRTMSEEFQRVASHLMWYAAFVQDIGLMSPFLYGMRDRDLVLDLFQSYTGGRLTYEYMRVGGVRNDLPPGFTDQARKVCDWLSDRFVEYDRLCLGSDIFHRRCDNLGVLKASECIRYGITGPMLRSAGVARDLRKDRPYAAYGQVDFEVAVADGADVTGRYLVRMEELRQSLRILRQTLDWLDRNAGPVMAENVPRWMGAPYAPVGREGYLLKREYPKGVGFSAIEEPHGEALAYVVNEGGEHPYRVKLKSPVFVNIAAARQYLVGYRVADIPPIMGSVDVCVGEVDR
ncbi:MAG: NADH-quinone oxidoreductase subunit D [Thermoplasmata archaeon]|nr:NADH-quinone oxidoreductase subunit D [Thermoplasmata archaeon]MCI4338317.1 NADH-quinone oxidoreductase subunit D [Thermoplasmata archaeon]MCI4341195.1 NADH-quinone oxidoreductase subunit D [Thermoplasmata archaeon]